MNTILLIKILLIAIQVLFIGRFHLEIGNVNGFMEPVSTIRRITNPLVMPVKKLLPNSTMKKSASLLVAYLITAIILIFFLSGVQLLTILTLAGVMLISTWISFLQYGMFLFVIGSWIQIPALQRLNYVLHGMFQPLLRPIQKVLPSLGGLDFSPIAFLLLLSFVADLFSKAISG